MEDEIIIIDTKKYLKMENVLQHINKNFITVNDEDAKRANPVLKHVINEIIDAMKKTSPLFKALFTEIFYGGSYFDGLKVGKPEEFDIDLLLILPFEVAVETTDQPGYVRIKLIGWSNFEKDKNKYDKYKDLHKLKDAENYLLVNELLQWMQSILTLSLNNFSWNGRKYLIPYNGKNVEVSLKNSGPALTTIISYEGIYMDVDMVAVFKLPHHNWPSYPFKSLPEHYLERDFMIVPKAPQEFVFSKNRYWRLSFQEQETFMFSGLNYSGLNNCKTALRLIKKLRDTQNHKLISSYYIKTIFLHEIDRLKNPKFWNLPLSFVLMHMLKRYKAYLENYKIPYYWNAYNNLIQNIDEITIDNFKNFLSHVIRKVDNNIDDYPFIIALSLLTPVEVSLLKLRMSSNGESEDSMENAQIVNSMIDNFETVKNNCSIL